MPKTLSTFEPPFCPNERCAHHTIARGTPWPWQARGTKTIRRPPRLVRQFSCKSCGRWFRSSVFGPDYWHKLAGIEARVFDQLANGAALRRAARLLRCAPTTVRRAARRVARQCLLLHFEQLARLIGKLREIIQLDGQRSFAGSRYEELDLQSAVGSASGFVYHNNIAPRRRSGEMTVEQKITRAKRDADLGRPELQIRLRQVEQMLQRLLALAGEEILRLATDEEPDYARAVAALQPAKIQHETISSRAPRNVPGHPLRRVNQFHAYSRHALRSLVRKTIAFAKTAAGLLDRAWIQGVAQNNTKGTSERHVGTSRTTPAMRLGLATSRRDGRSLLAQRRFPKRVGLPADQREAYDGTFKARPNERVKPYRFVFVS
jgi:hypothetical protein